MMCPCQLFSWKQSEEGSQRVPNLSAHSCTAQSLFRIGIAFGHLAAKALVGSQFICYSAYPAPSGMGLSASRLTRGGSSQFEALALFVDRAARLGCCCRKTTQHKRLPFQTLPTAKNQAKFDVVANKSHLTAPNVGLLDLDWT